MTPISDILQTVTADQVYATWVTGLVNLGVPADKWRKGGVASSILRIIAITYAAFSVTMVAALSGQFLDYATGKWLVFLAKYVYGVDAITATFATGNLTVANTGGFIFSYAPGELVVLGANGIQYANTAALSIGAVGSPTAAQSSVPFEALTAGSVGSANPGTITQLVTTALGLTVTNPTSFVGTDAEKDEDLRQRCRDKLGSLSVRGPRDAFEWAAKTATRADGTPVNVNRVAISTSSSLGRVVVTVASPSGIVDSTDLTAIGAFIEANVRPQTVTVVVQSATTANYGPTMTVWAKTAPGLSSDTILAAVEDAITAYLATYPIGGLAKPPATQGYLWASGVEGVVKGSHPAIFAVDGITGDLALATTDVATDAVVDADITVRLI